MPPHLAGLEELVLLAVAGLGDAAYGVTVQAKLQTQARSAVSIGAVYTALERLERRGLVRSAMGEATAARGGRRKRLFRATPQGLAALREMERIRNRIFTFTPRPA